jgi:hypothetical protein
MHFVDTLLVNYRLLSFLLYTGLLGWVLVRSTRWSRWFVPVALIVLVLLRLPSLLNNREFNPDESQMLTQAMTLGQYDPVYLRAVDTTTGGPLNSYLLMLPGLVGLPYDFITARLMACLLVLVNLYFFYKTARLWAGDASARLTLLSAVFVVGMTYNADFLHYSSELLAVALLSAGSYLYARQTTQLNSPPLWLLLVLGFVLGMVPFAKLQGVPAGITTGVFAALDLWQRPGSTIQQRAGRTLALIVGGILFPSLFLGAVAASGKLSDFLAFYIGGNLSYQFGNTLLQRTGTSLMAFRRHSDEFLGLVLLTGLISVGAIWRAIHVGEWPRRLYMPLGFVLTLLLTNLYATVQPGTGFIHYLQFLLNPVLLLSAIGLSVLLPVSGGRSGWFIAVMGLLLVGKTTLGLWWHRPQQPGRYPVYTAGSWRLTVSPVVQQIGRYARPGEPLAVWGWRNDYYIQAQMPQGTAENHPVRCMIAGPLRATYRSRYLNDLNRTRPPVFVDALEKTRLAMVDTDQQPYENYAPLRAYIATHYQLTDSLDNNRIYVRRDRLAAIARYTAR